MVIIKGVLNMVIMTVVLVIVLESIVKARTPTPLPVQCADTPILPILYHGVTKLIPMEEVVIEPCCSLGVELVKGSSKGKVEGTPKYMPTSPLVDWNAVADEMAAGPDSLDKDSLEDLTMSWCWGIG
jgi:hypothetical protein